MTVHVEEMEPEATNAELVHWMSPRRTRGTAAALPAATMAAFCLGVATAFALIATFRWVAPPRPTLH